MDDLATAAIREKIMRLSEAIEAGEILRIRYNAGSQAGAVRDLRPLIVDGVHLRAFDENELRPKTFRLGLLEIVGLDVAVTYKANPIKRRKIGPAFKRSDDAAAYFASITKHWAFHVPTALSDAIDIHFSKSTTTDKSTKKKASLYFISCGDPRQYAFQPGDVFHYPREAAIEPWGSVDAHYCLQVMEGNLDEVIAFRALAFARGQTLFRKNRLTMAAASFAELLEHGLASPEWNRLFDAP